jgi:hypothetical protein
LHFVDFRIRSILPKIHSKKIVEETWTWKMKFSLNFCGIEVIVLCWIVPAILWSTYDNREFTEEAVMWSLAEYKEYEGRFPEWKKIIGEFCSQIWRV